MAGVGFVAVLALGICTTLLLYALIRGETSDPEIVDRETAERRAMERGGRADGAPEAGKRRGESFGRRDGRAGDEEVQDDRRDHDRWGR